MPSKKNFKQKSADPYTRVACDIRKQLMAMEKKEKKRPRMATALSDGAEKVIARSFGTSEDARQPLDHKVATPASFGNLAARDAALARSEAQSPAGGGASSALGILSPAGRHLLLAERVKPDGHRSPNPHKSPEGVMVPTLSPDYVSPLGITKRRKKCVNLSCFVDCSLEMPQIPLFLLGFSFDKRENIRKRIRVTNLTVPVQNLATSQIFTASSKA
ncbi:uncharacterized protein LOC142764886 [Rhipicephalus microplus]|uniref:uncharacterized protein LOC142764886 n=1 Tax=Rhipicephalus microplus TaxID=6941 RepID=UPI003F6CEA80